MMTAGHRDKSFGLVTCLVCNGDTVYQAPVRRPETCGPSSEAGETGNWEVTQR